VTTAAAIGPTPDLGSSGGCLQVRVRRRGCWSIPANPADTPRRRA